MENKVINRDGQDADKIFDDRSMQHDYRTLPPLLTKGMRVLDIGCGTGSITKDIAYAIGIAGHITGIDNTQKFIDSGKVKYGDVKNMTLQHVDLFNFTPDEKFDLIVAARTLQWLSKVPAAIEKIKAMLKPGGTVSILDYNHTKAQWTPAPPQSMRTFYDTFLKWRSDAGMNNAIADELPQLLQHAGFNNITVLNADEHYTNADPNFPFRAGIWSKVAGSRQMVEEGYVDDALRLQAIEDYNRWIERDGQSMTLKLNDVRATL